VLGLAEGIKVILLTGRTLYQGTDMEAKGKTSREYWEAAAQVRMDPEDMARIGVKEGDPVRFSTAYGSVVVRAVKSAEAPHPGVVFIPYGPWANMVTNPTTHSTGMPSYKGVDAFVEPAPDERVLELRELLRAAYGRS